MNSKEAWLLLLTTTDRTCQVSAGVFNSPQLLMVSGVGPADQLTPLGIPIVHENSNVGQNMW